MLSVDPDRLAGLGEEQFLEHGDSFHILDLLLNAFAVDPCLGSRVAADYEPVHVHPILARLLVVLAVVSCLGELDE